MKKNYTRLAQFLLMICCLSFTAVSHAQAPSWQWAKNSTGSSIESSTNCTADSNGNAYLVGLYQPGSPTFGTTVLPNTGERDSYIVKYNPSGAVVWAKNIGGLLRQEVHDICVDNSGNIFITGAFDSAALTIDGITVTNSAAAGTQEAFIAKLDANGTAIWIKTFSGAGIDYGMDILTDASGNIYVGGQFMSTTLNVGGIVVNNFEIDGDHDIFFAKLDANGNALWAKSAGGQAYDEFKTMALDADGNLYIGGSFYSYNIEFGDILLLTNTNDYGDSYIAKYSPTGEAIWANKVGGTDYDDVRSIKADSNGNVFIAGHSKSPTVTFDLLTSLVNAGNNDVFLAKYNATGDLAWARRAGGANSDIATEVIVDAEDNAILVGSFASPTITFGSLSALSTNGSQDIFVTKYDTNGNALWTKNNGGTNADYAYQAASDGSDNLFVSGHMNSGQINFDGNLLNSSVSTCVYLAKIGLGPLSTESFDASDAIAVFPNPATEYLYVQSAKLPNTYQIYDLNGRIVQSGEVSDSKMIAVSKLQNGLYFIAFGASEKIKFIKK